MPSSLWIVPFLILLLLNYFEWRIRFPTRILAHTKTFSSKRKLWITELIIPLLPTCCYYSVSHCQKMMRSDGCIGGGKNIQSSEVSFLLLLLTLLFSWTSSVQQLTTIWSYTLYTKEIQVWEWLSLTNINAKLQDPSSKDHSLPLYSSSDKNDCTWLWNMISFQDFFFIFHQDVMIHDFNFCTF